jgi:hypothetical protein
MSDTLKIKEGKIYYIDSNDEIKYWTIDWNIILISTQIAEFFQYIFNDED